MSYLFMWNSYYLYEKDNEKTGPRVKANHLHIETTSIQIAPLKAIILQKCAAAMEV